MWEALGSGTSEYGGNMRAWEHGVIPGTWSAGVDGTWSAGVDDMLALLPAPT